MLKLESGEIGELVGSTILMAVVDRLIELDVSNLNFPWNEKIVWLLYVIMNVLEYRLGGDWMGCHFTR